MSRTPASALYWRILGINGLIFAVGTAALAVGPVTVSSPILLRELPVLAIGLAVMMAANAFLLRASLAPLEALTALMARMNSLRSGDRLAKGGNGDLFHLVDQFNAMLDRLEAERSTSTALVLDAQEAERSRIAQELHDEIGQTLTVVLLELKSVVNRAPEEVAEELRGVRRSSGRAWTRCAAWPGGCAPASWTTWAWAARSPPWPRSSPGRAACTSPAASTPGWRGSARTPSW